MMKQDEKNRDAADDVDPGVARAEAHASAGEREKLAFSEPVTLEGVHVRLVPLAPGHREGLISAARDGELWRLWFTSVPEPETMEAEIERRLDLQASGSMTPFTVIESATGIVVGMTTYMNIDAVSRRVEIGSTWYAARAQKTAINSEAKFLLLEHAFEALDCIAVEFRTHRLNDRSRRAIERLGAQLDGILRQHQRSRDGTLRDTCVYSIIASEWPAIRTHLLWQLQKPR